MAFNHTTYNQRFIEHLKTHPEPLTPDPKYGVRLVKAVGVAEEELYWRVIGIHHLKPLENMSNRNVYMDVLGAQGNRLKNPVVWAGWTWEGIRAGERADPTPLDKPDSEPAGNISVGSNQKVTVWIEGVSRNANEKSDRVEGLHTLHPDEPLPDGRKLNTLGHHSFYVVWQRTRKGAVVTPPPVVVTPPVATPPPAGDWQAQLDDRQRKQIAFSRRYAAEFNHGAVGHSDMILIARLADLLDAKGESGG